MARLTILSYGGGQDSTTILYKLANDPDFRKKYAPDKLIVIMADTGNEHKTTDYYREYIQDYCKERNIPFFFISSYSEYYLEGWRGGLVAFMDRNQAIPSKAYPKSCTDQLKVRPIYKFVDECIFRASKEVQRAVITSIKNPEVSTFLLQQAKEGSPSKGNHVFPVLKKLAIKKYAELYGKIDVLIGIARGEEKRVAKNNNSTPKWFQQSINRVYPLIDEAMDRQDCQDYITSIKELVPYPSNCILCPFMSLQELLYMYHFNEEWYWKLVKMEENKIARFKKLGTPDKNNLGVWGTQKMLPEKLEEAFEKFGDWTQEDLEEYKMSHGHCVQSTY